MIPDQQLYHRAIADEAREMRTLSSAHPGMAHEAVKRAVRYGKQRACGDWFAQYAARYGR